MTDLIAAEDLPASIAGNPSAALMIAGANGQAARVAPCLVSTDPAPAQLAEAKLILLGAITRWTQQGASGVQQQVAGPFSVGTFQSQSTGYRLWPSEITQLQAICRGEGDGPTIGSIDTAPGRYLTREHLAGCDFWYRNGNGSSCSCGLW